MQIDSLKIENFRRFANQNFSFNNRFNLIVGENGAGKTSLLDAIAVATGSWFLGIQGYDSRSIKQDEVRVLRNEFEGVITYEGQYPVSIKAEGIIQSSKVEWTRTLNGPGGRTTRTGAQSAKDISEQTAQAVSQGEPCLLPLIAHYGAGRLWVQPRDMNDFYNQKQTHNSRLDGYLYSLDPRINFSDLFQWIRKEKYISLQDGKERKQYVAVKNAILSCLDHGKSIDYSVKEEDIMVEIDPQGILPFRLLSDGQRNMIALAADIGFKAAQLNPQLGENVLQETPGIVLIDEIDLLLHPKWQRHVINDLKKTFPKIQFFASTHSPQIIGETPIEEVILLTENGPVHPSIAYGADSKGNWPKPSESNLFISPTDGNCETAFDFRQDGSMVAVDGINSEKAAKLTIEKLQLNDPELKDLRKSSIQGFLDGLSRENLLKLLNRLKEDESKIQNGHPIKLLDYCFVYSKIIEKLLNQWYIIDKDKIPCLNI
ncbi:AAA domain protein [Leptospira weilii serovar Ranarum str. ICFT]|uniref:AAA domain protein n=1 Tax=Leptospira weilii serovar Ranarum str. ICFT TaxID=1218598 RepID=N1WGF0_9LEPT|nr:AAA family ATPase [Leptospira weilii]EMY78010.1 AAA domain protein [Leptospira weilii serovar Ranarum str. ICFT]